MNKDDLKRKFNKGIALLVRFFKNPVLTYDDFFQFEFEKKMGIVTRGCVKDNELGISLDLNPHAYVPGGNIYLKYALKKMNISESDSIIDLGCGLGSPMFYMMKFPFKKISGVEYSKELYEGCQRNLDKLNDQRLNVFFSDAGNFNSFNEYNYIFMYNPFGITTMRKVIEKIAQSYIENPRVITLIYKNPVFDNAIIDAGVFQKVSEYKTEDDFKLAVYKTNKSLS